MSYLGLGVRCLGRGLRGNDVVELVSGRDGTCGRRNVYIAFVSHIFNRTPSSSMSCPCHIFEKIRPKNLALSIVKALEQREIRPAPWVYRTLLNFSLKDFVFGSNIIGKLTSCNLN